MTAFEGGQVVLVHFVFTSGEAGKQRPAVVVSTEAYHSARQEIIIAAITSNTVRVLPGDSAIQDWKEAGLLFPSLMTAIVRTVRQDMVTRQLGRISARDAAAIKKCLKGALFI